MTALALVYMGRAPIFDVHAASCGDLSKRKYAGRDIEQVDAESLRDLVEDMYCHQIEESGGRWDIGYVDDFKFYPCVKLPREVTS